MRFFSTLALLATATTLATAQSSGQRNYETHDYYAIHLDPTVSPSDLAQHLGLEHEGPLSSIPDHHVFSTPKTPTDIVDDAIQDLKKRRKRGLQERSPVDGVLLGQKQVLRRRLFKREGPAAAVAEELVYREQPAVATTPQANAAIARQQDAQKTLGIADPIFTDQWHLINTESPGNDLNVTGVWMQGITGKNATVCIIDDGLDMASLDLGPNYMPEGSFDFNDRGPIPKPRLAEDRHGTRCAGEIAAVKNDVCGIGVAYDSKISGIRILSKPISDVDEAEAVNFKTDINQIYSCSWGPPDDGRTMDGPGILIRKAFITAIQKGRQGLGTIYVLAAGNGAANDDNCNFDGYANSLYTITVGAIDKKNQHPYYSEKCSAQLFVTYSSGSGDSIHTTDVGRDVCTSSHGGTSAAGPLAAGVYALVLSLRPELSWRDVQYLGVMAAVPFYDVESDWQDTAIGKKYSHQFGYGKLDAYGMVEMAKDWTPVKPQAWYFTKCIYPKKEIPQGDIGIAVHWDVTEADLKKANIARLEHVQVLMNVDHTRRGDLSVELHSPSGVISHLATARRSDNAKLGYRDWQFMSVAHWGEKGVGRWTIIVKDSKVDENKGTFQNWQLRLWGESIDGKNQPLFPLPDEKPICPDSDTADEDLDHHTTSVSHPAVTGAPTGNPTDHPDRPINQKPTDGNSKQVQPTQTTAAAAVTQPTASSTSTSTSTAEHLLPGAFPTFGVSKTTQVWIYGSIALILVFCCSLAGYFLWQKRRQRRSRDAYEFEMLDDREADEGAGGGAGDEAALMGGGRRKKRAGELYDAFAGDSDEDVFSDDDEEEADRRYRDRPSLSDDNEQDEKARLTTT